MAYIDTVKPWFETGDYPTQAQFYQWMEWLRWKDEALQMTDVAGLADAINNIASIASVKALFRELITLTADGSYDMAAGLIITGIVVDCATDLILKIGTTPGGNEIADSVAITGGTPEAISIVIYAKAAKTIYLSGITAATNFILLKNPL